ncbi:hypothetical protein [Pseudorhodoplanes sp.]|uniref:hypothetical protein n=1 Tax=Pseudorhodoplanes sp. TaxID=1934341 RepID=UPI003D0B9E5D
MSESPLDSYEVQLAGRLLAIEALITILLRQNPAGGLRIIRQTEEALSHTETLALKGMTPSQAKRTVATFAAGRESLDAIATKVREAAP